MKNIPCLLLLLPALLTPLFACAQKDAPVTVAQPGETWEPAYVGSDSTVLFLPDAYAVYWKYSWKPEPGKGFVIRGKFPEARYFSYNVYDDAKKATLGSYVGGFPNKT
jgi:hypothetical protein